MKRKRTSLPLPIALGLVSCSSPVAVEEPVPDGCFIDTGGERIFVRQVGSGPDIVLLHGLGDSSAGFKELEQRLVETGYRVTAWDALGAGRSSKPDDGDYSLPAHRKRLLEVMDAVGVRQAVLLGNSLGGSLALMVAATDPERVRALALLDPAAYREGALGSRWFWDTPILAEVVLGILPCRTIATFGLKRNLHSYDALPQDLVEDYVKASSRDGAISAFIAQERQIIPPEADKWEASHRDIRVPTLVIWGREDGVLPLAQGERLAREIPGALLVVLPDVGHAPHLEAPGSVFALIWQFLRQNGIDPR